MSKSLTEHSKSVWTLPADQKPSIELLQLGCFQRIADATELMVENTKSLIVERDSLKQSLAYWKARAITAENKDLEHSRQITRLKNQVKKLKA